MNKSLDQQWKKVREESALYIHMINEPPDIELEGKPIGPNLSET